MTDPRRVTILGSTGSIGTQAIDVVLAARDRFTVTAICAGSDVAALAAQAARLRVHAVGVADESQRAALESAVAAAWPAGAPRPEVLAGAAAVVDLAARDADVV